MSDTPISSAATGFYRLVFAPVWLIGFNTVALRLALDSSASPLTPSTRLILGAAALFGSAFVVWSLWPLRSVALRDGTLVVRHWGRDAIYPLTDLLQVVQVPLVRPASATLVFRRNHGAGTRVRLLLPFEPWTLSGAPFLGDAPSVVALRERLLSPQPALGRNRVERPADSSGTA